MWTDFSTTKFFRLGVLTILGLLLAQCDRKRPTEPEILPDYTVWFADDAAPGNFYGFHPTTGQIDSFQAECHPTKGMDITNDGRLLIVGDEDSTCIVDIAVEQVVRVMPYGGQPVLSPDDRLLAIQGDSLLILNTDDLSIHWKDTIRVRGGSFNGNGTAFYCTKAHYRYFDDSYYYANRISLIDTSRLSRGFTGIGPGITQVLASHDETIWYVRHYFGLYAYNVISDSIILSSLHWGEPTGMDISTDGNQLLYSYAGDTISGFYPQFSFGRLDTRLEEVYEIKISGNCYDPPPGHMSTWGIRMTPDDRWAVMVGGLYGGYIVCWDMRENRVDRELCLGENRAFRQVACQKGL